MYVNRLLLVLMLLPALTLSTVKPSFGADTWEARATAELYKLLNAHRKRHNLPVVKTDPQLARAAQGLSDHMAATGTFSHEADGRTFEERIKAEGYRSCASAENILQNHKGKLTRITRSMMKQWTTSPDHNADMLGQYENVGIGVAVANDGRSYATQVFGTRC